MATTPNAATPADLSWSPRALLRRMRGADEIAHVITFIAAATLLLITVLLVYQLWVLSAEARHKFGWSFFVTKTWDPVAGDFGPCLHLWNFADFRCGSGAGGSAGRGWGHFLAELAPPKLSSSLTFVSDCLRRSQRDLRIAGRVPAGADHADDRPTGPEKDTGILAAISGPAYGIGFLTAASSWQS